MPGNDAEGLLRLDGMRLMVCPKARAESAAGAILLRNQWPALLALCVRWKLLASLEARVSALQIALPEAERAELSRGAQAAFVQTMLCLRAGVTALSALEAAGIRCAGFKGLASLAYLYPALRSRTLQDVDVLIEANSLKSALEVLEANGFARCESGSLEDYLDFVRHSPGAAGNEAVSLRDARHGAVDLHWRLGALDIPRLLADAQPVTMLQRSVPLMSPSHSMLLSVHHALRNDFVPADIARDVCDFAHWLPLLGESGQWRAAGLEAERWGLSSACGALACIVAELQGHPEAEPLFPMGGAELDAGRHLAACYFRQLADGPLNTDLAYLAGPRPLMQVALGLASGWSRYRAFMRRSEEANGEESLPLLLRLWRLGKSLIALSPNEWRQIRALARAKDRMATEPLHSTRYSVDRGHSIRPID